MDTIVQINTDFIENNTNFNELIAELKNKFASNSILVPMRHHHDFPNPVVQEDSTLLLMPPGILVKKQE